MGVNCLQGCGNDGVVCLSVCLCVKFGLSRKYLHLRVASHDTCTVWNQTLFSRPGEHRLAG